MRYFIASFVLMAGLFLTSPAIAAVNVFACLPEWGALAKEIGAEDVSVYTATNAQQNVHYLSAKPSLLSKMRKADLVFCNGASLEIGWLPLLMQKAAGPDVQVGKPGYLLAADQVNKLGIPKKVDRSMGDVHPEGNPHIHLDPRNILTVAGVLAERLATIDPTNAQDYRSRLNAFQERWENLMVEWKGQTTSLRGANVVVYHTNWAYLLNWIGMNPIASLEPKPGLAGITIPKARRL